LDINIHLRQQKSGVPAKPLQKVRRSCDGAWMKNSARLTYQQHRP
jgi:hypothetical protein